MYNTPPTFSIYMAGLTFQWLKRQTEGGLSGVAAMEARNIAKAALLYGYIDQSTFYFNKVADDKFDRMGLGARRAARAGGGTQDAGRCRCGRGGFGRGRRARGGSQQLIGRVAQRERQRAQALRERQRRDLFGAQRERDGTRGLRGGREPFHGRAVGGGGGFGADDDFADREHLHHLQQGDRTAAAGAARAAGGVRARIDDLDVDAIARADEPRHRDLIGGVDADRAHADRNPDRQLVFGADRAAGDQRARRDREGGDLADHLGRRGDLRIAQRIAGGGLDEIGGDGFAGVNRAGGDGQRQSGGGGGGDARGGFGGVRRPAQLPDAERKEHDREEGSDGDGDLGPSTQLHVPRALPTLLRKRNTGFSPLEKRRRQTRRKAGKTAATEIHRPAFCGDRRNNRCGLKPLVLGRNT